MPVLWYLPYQIHVTPTAKSQFVQSAVVNFSEFAGTDIQAVDPGILDSVMFQAMVDA